MGMGHPRTLRKHQTPCSIFSTPLLFFISLFPRFSYAQISDAPLSSTTLTSGRTPILSSSTMRSPISRTDPQVQATTLFTTPAIPNIPSSSTTSEDSPYQPELFPSVDPADVDRQRSETVFNYYFLFLAAFGFFIVISLWLIHRRRKRRKEQMRLSGHNALARDLDGWVNTRRWMHGAWRHNQTAGLVRREEGLNEHGEAPPPYEPKQGTTTAQGAVGIAQDPASGLAIPLRTLSRDGIERIRPPRYQEAAAGAEPDTPITHIVRPETDDRHPNPLTNNPPRV